MTRVLMLAAVLCSAAVFQAQQTSIAPSPTPAQQPGPAPRAAAAPRGGRGTAASPPVAPSTAPLANSKVEIIGNPQHPGQPSDDKPMLPITPVPNALGMRSGTPISIQLKTTADSGHLRNGDMIEATLAQPVAGMQKGTPVRLTVVQASRAGTLVSYGELSLQVIGIGRYDVLSDIVTALGKEGKKEIADAAPSTGTEAEFAAGQEFTFPSA